MVSSLDVAQRVPDRSRRPIADCLKLFVRVNHVGNRHLLAATDQHPLTKGTPTMEIHKKILEWQAAHPTITWIVWGIIWIIVFILLFSPKRTGAM